MSLKSKLFQEMFSTFAIVDPTQRTKNRKIDPTQPMGQPKPWTSLIETAVR